MKRYQKETKSYGKPVINLTGGEIEREIVRLYDARDLLLKEIWNIEDQILNKFRKIAHIGKYDCRINFHNTEEGVLEINSYDVEEMRAIDCLELARRKIAEGKY